MRRISLACALLVVLVVAGSSKGAEPGTSPQATFDAMKSAAANKDWKGIVSCMTPDSQDQMIGGMAMMVKFMGAVPGAGDKLKGASDILKKHGVQLDAAPKLPGLDAGAARNADPDEVKKKMAEAMKTMTVGVKDKPACMGELMEWFEKNGDATQKKRFNSDAIAASTLADVKIDGDTQGDCAILGNLQ